MDKDPIKGSGQEADPTVGSGYHQLDSSIEAGDDTGTLDPVQYDIHEIALRDDSKIDLIKRACELGVLDLKVESPVFHWTEGPMP